jgi:hypothetical protein
LYVNREKIGDAVCKTIEQTKRSIDQEAETRKIKREARTALQWLEVDSLIEKHAHVLVVKRNSLITVDDYGKPDASAWEQEKSYFINKVVIADFDLESSFISSWDIMQRIDVLLDR